MHIHLCRNAIVAYIFGVVNFFERKAASGAAKERCFWGTSDHFVHIRKTNTEHTWNSLRDQKKKSEPFRTKTGSGRMRHSFFQVQLCIGFIGQS